MKLPVGKGVSFAAGSDKAFHLPMGREEDLWWGVMKLPGGKIY